LFVLRSTFDIGGEILWQLWNHDKSTWKDWPGNGMYFRNGSNWLSDLGTRSELGEEQRTAKMRLANESLDRRLGLSWEQAQLAGAKGRPQCVWREILMWITCGI
jgi:hypothetical protein